jgi:hypothetical protein
MIMDKEEDFGEGDPEEFLAECVDDFLCNDLDQNFFTGIKNSAVDFLSINLVEKKDYDNCHVYDGVCIDKIFGFTVCGLCQYKFFL